MASTARPSSRQGQSAVRAASPVTAQVQVPGPARTRSARNQSQDPDISGPAPTRRSRRQASAEAEPVSLAPAARGTRRQRAAGDVATDLPPVVEDALVQGDAMDPTFSPAVSTGHHSVASATTAKTSFSQEELQDLDRDLILDSLPNLVLAADDLGNLLTTSVGRERTWKELRTPGSIPNKLYKNRDNTLNLQRDHFGSQEYIQPDIIVRALLSTTTVDELPNDPWRPDTLLYKVNLVLMLRSLLTHFADENGLNEESIQAIGRLDTEFPKLIAGGDLDVDSFNLSLAITTQHAIAQLLAHRDHSHFSAASIIRSIFFVENVPEGESVHKLVVAFGLDGRSDNERYQPRLRELDETVRSLEEPFTTRSVVDALVHLQAIYPRDKFIAKAVHYYSIQRKSYEKEISAAGGLGSIMGSLKEAMQLREEDKKLHKYRASFGKTGTAPKTKKNYGKPQFIRNMQSRTKLREEAERAAALTATAALAHPSAIPAPVAQMTQSALDPTLMGDGGTWISQGNVADEAPEPETNAQDVEQNIVQRLTGYEDRPAQSRRFLDSQEDAQRMDFTQTPTSQYPLSDSRSHMPGLMVEQSSALGKRARSHDDRDGDFEPLSQDDGFQTDEREVGDAAADRRQRNAQLNARSATSRPNPGQGQGARERRNPGSSIPAPGSPGEPGDGSPKKNAYYQEAKVAAKRSRIIASHSKRPQIRTPWDDNEEEALIELIQEHGEGGISYSELKQLDEAEGQDQKLPRRSAEDMRFKARNMKQTMLLAGVGLPSNWQHVKLDKKAIDKLHSRGVDYFQEHVRAERAE